jgi:hypothetical protein
MSDGLPKPDQPMDTPAHQLDAALKLWLAVVAAMEAVVVLIGTHPILSILGGVIVTAFLAWVLIRRILARNARQVVSFALLPTGGSAYLRGLLPFELGDTLLGRDNDLRRALAKINSRACRFAYISGEAGVGKTSLLRSAVIPDLRKLGFEVIYCAKTGDNPITAALSQMRVLSPEADIPEESTLSAGLQLTGAALGKPLVLIWDQFEEFFIARRTQQDRLTTLQQIGEACADETIAARLVVSLRKDFVDDLHDLAAWVPQPLDANFSWRMRNWDATEAATVLYAAAVHDGIPFARRLQEQVIRDLEVAGEVRPVELQLVASRLGELRIYEMGRYRDAGGASGILTSYVAEVIHPNFSITDPSYERVARVTLRLLCAESADAKRPVGLTLPEIVDRVVASVKGVSSAKVRDLVAACLRRGVCAYLLVLEDAERYNLRHDYIARSIYEATSHMETIEHRANRALDYYLQLDRAGRSIISRKDLRLIRRFATPQRKSDAAAVTIIATSRKRHAVEAASLYLVLLVFVTLLYPPTVEYHFEEPFKSLSPDLNLALAANGTTAAYLQPNGKAWIWKLSEPWTSAVPVDIPMRDITGEQQWRVVHRRYTRPPDLCLACEQSADNRNASVVPVFGIY